jgi:hypothetical protein
MAIIPNEGPLIKMLCERDCSLPALRRIDPLTGKPPIFKHRLIPGSWGEAITNNAKDWEILKTCLRLKRKVIQQESKRMCTPKGQLPNTVEYLHYENNIKTLAKQILIDNGQFPTEENLNKFIQNPETLPANIPSRKDGVQLSDSDSVLDELLRELEEMSAHEIEGIIRSIEREPEEVQQQIAQKFFPDASVEVFLEKVRNGQVKITEKKLVEEKTGSI